MGDRDFRPRVLKNPSLIHEGVGAGVELISPEKLIFPYSFTLIQLCSNNVAKYQPLILSL